MPDECATSGREGLEVAAWREVLDALGMAPVGGRGRQVVLEGELRRRRVVAVWDGWAEPPLVSVEVSLDPGFDTRILPAGRAPWPTVRPTGDAAFDGEVCLLDEGRDPRPWLDGPTRGLLRALTARGVWLGAARLRVEGGDLASPAALEALLSRLVELAERLERPLGLTALVARLDDSGSEIGGAVRRLLRERVTQLRSPAEVRELCDEARRAPEQVGVELLLVALDAGCPEPRLVVRTALELAPGDPDLLARVVVPGAGVPLEGLVDLVLAACRAEEHEVVERVVQGWWRDTRFAYALAERLIDDPEPAALRLLARLDPQTPAAQVEVLRALGHLDEAELDQRYLQQLDRGMLEVRHAAARALAAVVSRLVPRDDPEALQRLEAVRSAAERSSVLLDALVEELGPDEVAWLAALEPRSEHDVVRLLLRLGELGGPVEVPLLRWLDDGRPDVRIAAVHALGRVGTSRAVEPLRRLTRGLFVDARLKATVDEALAAVRGRLDGSAEGALSVPPSGGGEGGLSLGAGGRLSEP